MTQRKTAKGGLHELNRAGRPSLSRGQWYVIRLRPVLLQEGLDQKAVGHAVKRPVDGGFQVVRFLYCLTLSTLQAYSLKGGQLSIRL